MLSGMLKRVASFLCPSSARLARHASARIAGKYNGLPEDTRMLLARYSSRCRVLEEYHARLDEMISNGSIDECETEELAKMLEPIIESARQLVFS